MARTFNGTSDTIIRTGITPLAYPFSFAGWFKTSSATSQAVIGYAATAADSGQVYQLMWVDGTFHVHAEEFDLSINPGAVTTVAGTGGAWNHGVAVFNSASDRRAYINGGNKITNATTVAAIAEDNIGIGIVARTAQAFPFNGSIAEVGIWNVALTDNDVAALFSGVSPLMVRSAALVNYWPLIGQQSPENDVMVAAQHVTLTGTTAGTHVPIIRAKGSRAFQSVFGAITSVTLTATQAQVATLVKTVNLIRTATQAQVATLSKLISLTRTAAQAQFALLNKRLPVNLLATQTQVARVFAKFKAFINDVPLEYPQDGTQTGCNDTGLGPNDTNSNCKG